MSDASGANASATRIAVLGAGSWGTALAIQFARASRPTTLWGRDPMHLADLERERRNARYLPEAQFPSARSSGPDLAAALRHSHDVLLAVPSHGLRATLTLAAPHLARDARIAWAT